MNQNNLDNFIIRRNQRTSLEHLMADETIFALGNGILGTRGHFIEGYGTHDYPQTFINGFYNTYPFKYEENYKQFPQVGQTIVNLPDASFMSITTKDGKLNLTESTLTSLERSLDLRTGVTYRKAIYHTPNGYQWILKEEKIVPFDQKVIVSKLSLTSVNYVGDIHIESSLMMPVVRKKSDLDPRLPHVMKHLELMELSCSHYGYLKAQTTHTKLCVHAGMTHDVHMDYEKVENGIIATHRQHISEGQTIDITKYQIYDHHQDGQWPLEMENIVKKVKPFEAYVKTSSAFYESFWKHAHLELSHKTLAQAIRYNVFQLNQSGGMNDLVSIAAKGMTGEGYEGHYFWDTEIYMLPFFILTHPKRARNVLMYRYHTLDKSRYEARQLGSSRGAKIAWRTINGYESSPYYPAGSAQIHINSDIAYAIKLYYDATQDLDFMLNFGLEIWLETALFLIEYGHFDAKGFHLYGVTGPDEYTALVNDNYYTNKMAQAHFEYITEFIRQHKEKVKPLLNALEVTDHDLIQFELAAQQMTLLIDEAQNIVKQDASFMQKKALDLNTLSQDQFPLLLNFHPLFIYKHQVLKQADAIVAMVLMNDVPLQTYLNSFEYYLKRTTHDSSLSKCMYGIAAYKLGKHALGFEYLNAVARLDLEDTKKYTKHGLHAANLGGSYLMIAYGLFGIRLGKMLSIDPAYQIEIAHASLSIQYQGHPIQLSLDNNVLTLETDFPLKLMVCGKMVSVDKHYQIGVKEIDYKHFSIKNIGGEKN